MKKPNAQHSNQPKNQIINIRLTSLQKLSLILRAKDEGLTLSAYVLRELNADKPYPFP